MTDGVKALRYAEENLGVHSVYEGAIEARDRLDGILTDLAGLRDKKRDLEYRLQDLELEVASDERGKHADMSQAAMDKHLKVVLHNNTDVRELREQLSKTVSDIEGLEFDRSIAETDIKIAVSRLHELGGYLEYLAAIKNQAGNAREASTTEGT